MTSEEEIVKIVEDVANEVFGASVKEAEQPEEMTKVKQKSSGSPKVKAKRKKSTEPKMNDWVRIKNSGGNSLPNETIHIFLDPSTGLAKIVTNARASEGSEDMEGERTQMFKFTSFEIND
jgi:hypothetical protein